MPSPADRHSDHVRQKRKGERFFVWEQDPGLQYQFTKLGAEIDKTLKESDALAAKIRKG